MGRVPGAVQSKRKLPRPGSSAGADLVGLHDSDRPQTARESGPKNSSLVCSVRPALGGHRSAQLAGRFGPKLAATGKAIGPGRRRDLVPWRGSRVAVDNPAQGRRRY